MDKRTAGRLGKRIENEDARITVTGYRHYDTGYAIDCVDTRTGDRFVVNSAEDWDARVAESRLYQDAGDWAAK
jgi:hypothetical protein